MGIMGGQPILSWQIDWMWVIGLGLLVLVVFVGWITVEAMQAARRWRG